MFSSIQIKQEYNSVDDRNHQTMVAGQESIDYSVFNNQNVEYAYHQLPHFWDQALQVQTNHYPKNFSQKNDGLSRQDMSHANQNIPSVSTNYINHHLQQQQQQQQQQQEQQNFTTSLAGANDQSQINQSNLESQHLDSRHMSAIVNNSILINPALTVESSSVINKRSTPGRPSKSSTGSPSKKHKCQCEICFKEFGHKSNLFIHMRTHNGERPYKCKQCDKCFTHSGNLAIHMRTHSGERPYACQECGKMFSHSGNLSTHLRTHSGVKPYKCSVCAKEFRHSGNLSIHERIHSGIKPFQCKVCGKGFYHSGNLTTHMKKHPVIASNEQCENNVLPTINSEYMCNNVNQIKSDTIFKTNSSDLDSTIQKSSDIIMEEDLHESKTS